MCFKRTGFKNVKKASLKNRLMNAQFFIDEIGCNFQLSKTQVQENDEYLFCDMCQKQADKTFH